MVGDKVTPIMQRLASGFFYQTPECFVLKYIRSKYTLVYTRSNIHGHPRTRGLQIYTLVYISVAVDLREGRRFLISEVPLYPCR